MKNAPGYPLPSGELGSDDIVCQLVYLPDRPEYWQAFVSSLHYLATWRAWERDDDKRGKDAASDWRVANELTMECWRMTCLQDLQDDVAAILAIMQIPQACCDPGDVTDGDQYTDRVQDGEGDVPQNVIDAGYADDAADWEGFDDYKCMIAHVTINQLEARLNEIAPLVDAAGGILGGVAALAGILAVIFGTGGLAIVFGIVAGIGATSLLYQAIMDFGVVESLAGKVGDNHDELACAVYQADGDAGALAALNDKIDELFTTVEALILKNMNLGPTLKALYSGRYDQQDIADILLDAGYVLDDFSCSECDRIGEFKIFDDWNDGTYAPLLKTGPPPLFTFEDPEWLMQWLWNDGSGAYIHYSVMWLRALAGLGADVGDTVTIREISFEYMMTSVLAGEFYVGFNNDVGLRAYTAPFAADWTVYTKTLSPARVSTYNLGKIFFVYLYNGSNWHGKIRNLTIDFDASPD